MLGTLHVQTNAQCGEGPKHECDFEAFPPRFQSRNPLACATDSLGYLLHAESLALPLRVHQ